MSMIPRSELCSQCQEPVAVNRSFCPFCDTPLPATRRDLEDLADETAVPYYRVLGDARKLYASSHGDEADFDDRLQVLREQYQASEVVSELDNQQRLPVAELPPTGRATPTSIELIYNRQSVFAAIAAALILVGSFGPWASITTAFGTISVGGMDGDGQITVVLAVIAGALIGWGMLAAPTRRKAVIALIAFVITAITGIYDWQNVSGEATVAWGLVLVTIAGIGGSIASLLMIRENQGSAPFQTSD